MSTLEFRIGDDFTAFTPGSLDGSIGRLVKLWHGKEYVTAEVTAISYLDRAALVTVNLPLDAPLPGPLGEFRISW